MNIEIIAESAQGFEGDPNLAMQLLRATAASGANAAKFQLVYADELCTPDYKDYEISKQLEMPESVWENLVSEAGKLGIELIFDVFGERSLALAAELRSKTVMLHATDINNFELISKVHSGPIDRVILGAGGAHFSEIINAIEALPNKNICIMLGYQGFPTPDEDNQISRVKYLTAGHLEQFENVVIGFSDHSLPESDLVVSLSAMALGAGAVMFEKHLTLAQVLKMEDHESAINPDQFSDYCNKLRKCHKAFGEVSEAPDFGMSDTEKGYRKFVRRNVIAGRNIKAGEKANISDFVFKRSSLEGTIVDINGILGKAALRDLKENQPILTTDFS
jgi:sialic acid synthase SpsE